MQQDGPISQLLRKHQGSIAVDCTYMLNFYGALCWGHDNLASLNLCTCPVPRDVLSCCDGVAGDARGHSISVVFLVVP